MFETIAAAQLPVVVLLLVLGTVAKVVTILKGVEPEGLSQMGPAVLVPERWRARMLLLCAVVELGLAAGLVATSHPLFRWWTVGFFAMSTFVLWELRRRRPDVGCGCFGEMSSAPVGLRSLGRTVVLTVMSVGLAWQDGGGWFPVPDLSWVTIVSALGGLVLIALLSPEIEEVVARIRYRAPCEQRPVAASTALARLRSSSVWQSHAEMLSASEPTDTWRELCWRFFSFSGRTLQGETVDVVFAVYLSGRRPAVKAAVVGANAVIRLDVEGGLEGGAVKPMPETVGVSA
ncbi:MauE/DoxX family redox-associated membrane protein [Sinosporangium album]|uniref:MauE/DoxX family redox-associated membrane protein n=1 Tax=Sinosporangium album TaxID=504805 RepID=UPI000A5F0D56|nr:MauE/DoxX family redox-associated membrane protein [Sinosporangium album]